MKKGFLYASMLLGAGLLLTNVYNSIIDARAWGSDFPASVETARNYYRSVNPGDFFRIFSPVNQLLALLVLILFWRTSTAVRRNLAIALVLYVLADIMTFAYFYPRNAIIFESDLNTGIESVRAAWGEWSSMNWLRSLVVLAGVIFSALGLHKVYAAGR